MAKQGLRWYFVLPLAFLAVALALDSISTYLAIHYGYANEGNPILALILLTPIGVPVFIFFKILGIALAAYIAYFIRHRAIWRQSLYAFLLIACASFLCITSLSNLNLALGGPGFF